MNFHSDEWIMKQLERHYDIAKEHFKEDQIVGIFLQGSQNYDMDTKDSDVDTKLIVLPTLEEIAKGSKPVSHTHIDSLTDEHIDFKDVRSIFQTFKKQNLNFIEVLYTKYKIVNPKYEQLWNDFISYNDYISKSNPVATLKTMKGIALEKYHALSHLYPSKVEVINFFGYDPKQLHHLVRVYDFMFDFFVLNKPYADCLKGSDLVRNLKDLSKALDFNTAKLLADETKRKVEDLYDTLMQKYEHFHSSTLQDAYKIIDEFQYKFIKHSIELELKEGEK